MNERLGKISVDDCRLRYVAEDYAAFWDRPSLGDYLAEHARSRGQATALWDASAEVTWEQLKALVEAATRTLWDVGVNRGDIVVLRGGNSVELAVLMLAVIGAGAVLCPVQDRSTMPEVEFILRQSGARFCLQTSSGHDQAELDEFRSMAQAQHGGSLGVVSIDWASGRVRIDCAVGAGAQAAPHDLEPWEGVAGPAPIRLLYTSGSTGAPKGVLHTHDTTMIACEKSTELHQWSPDSIGWIVVPSTLNWGMFQLFSSIIVGAKSMLSRRFDSAALISAIQGGGVTHIGLPPTGYIKLLDELPDGTAHGVLKMLISAGAPCSATLLERARAVLGVGIVEAYGMTEVGWLASTDPSDPVELSSGTVGLPTSILEMRVVDSSGQPRGTDEIGSVEVRGPSVFPGYFRNPDQTSAVFTDDGWFRTEDNGFFRADGRLTLAGREKDALKHGGQLVIPREIEELIGTMPNVRDVAVVGLPDSYYGDRIVAVLERNNETPPSFEEVVEFVRGRLAKFKWPQEVVVVDKLPRTPTGKVQKQRVVEQLSQISQQR